MTEGDKDLRDQLALSELDNDSTAYRQMRLVQMFGRFSAIAETKMFGSKAESGNSDKLDEICHGNPDCYPDEDTNRSDDQDNFDLMQALIVHEKKERNHEETMIPDASKSEDYEYFSW